MGARLSQCREVMWLDVYFGGGKKFGNKKMQLEMVFSASNHDAHCC